MSQPKLFTDEEAACIWLEQLRWPHGIKCPRCGNVGYRLVGRPDSSSPVRLGVYKCSFCSSASQPDQFSIRCGTILERSRVPLHLWLLAVSLLCQKALTSRELAAQTGLAARTAFQLISLFDRCASLSPLKALLGNKPKSGRRRRPFRLNLEFSAACHGLLLVSPTDIKT